LLVSVRGRRRSATATLVQTCDPKQMKSVLSRIYVTSYPDELRSGERRDGLRRASCTGDRLV